MKARRRGAFVFVTSARETRPEPGFAVPTTLRAATTAFAKALAKEAAPFGIQANVVAPNYLYSEMYYPRARFVDDPAGREVIAKLVPFGRLGEQGEVSALIAFLASGQSPFTTGQGGLFHQRLALLRANELADVTARPRPGLPRGVREGPSIQSAGQLEARSATDPLGRSRVHTLRFFLTREAVGTVWDHVRVDERRYTSKVLIRDCVARRPQLVHNFRNRLNSNKGVPAMRLMASLQALAKAY